MEIARVNGTVTATRKYSGLEGVRLLLLEALDENKTVHGDPFIACDATQAGPGDIVSWIGGREAALALPVEFVPVDATIVSIIHTIDARSLKPAAPKRKKSKAKRDKS